MTYAESREYTTDALRDADLVTLRRARRMFDERRDTAPFNSIRYWELTGAIDAVNALDPTYPKVSQP